MYSSDFDPNESGYDSNKSTLRRYQSAAPLTSSYSEPKSQSVQRSRRNPFSKTPNLPVVRSVLRIDFSEDEDESQSEMSKSSISTFCEYLITRFWVKQ